MVSLRHAKRDGIYLPVAPTSAMSLILRSNFLGSNDQKQSVSDAFQNVVLPPIAAPTSCKVAQREFATAKIRKKVES